MSLLAVVQARTGSTRLPAKVFEKIGGYLMLELVILRLKKSRLLNGICIATTINPQDSEIAEVCKKHRVSFYRGDETDVLSRYKEAAETLNAKTIVRVTSDCPFIDPFFLDEMIAYFCNNKFDYASNTLERTFPRGICAEVFNWETLLSAYQKADKDYQREHVTPFIRENGETFKLASIKCKSGNYSNYRLTVDTKEDLEMARKVFESLNKKFKNLEFTWRDIISVLDENPQFTEINSHIKQKIINDDQTSIIQNRCFI